MRTQGWWLNVAKYHSSKRDRASHYISIWLGDNRVGTDEKMKAVHMKELFPASHYHLTLSEEWISGKDHEI